MHERAAVCIDYREEPQRSRLDRWSLRAFLFFPIISMRLGLSFFFGATLPSWLNAVFLSCTPGIKTQCDVNASVDVYYMLLRLSLLASCASQEVWFVCLEFFGIARNDQGSFDENFSGRRWRMFFRCRFVKYFWFGGSFGFIAWSDLIVYMMMWIRSSDTLPDYLWKQKLILMIK